MEIELTEENFKEKILETKLVAIVDFWAPWCGPCKIVAPILEEIANQYKGKFIVGKLNVDEVSKIASQYSITSIPTLMIFKNGKVVEKIVGVTTKSYIEKKIKLYI